MPPKSSTQDKATLSLIRRTLAPSCSSNASPFDVLPSLTSSPELDYELYAFIAIILKEYVSVWYNKITPDQSFVEEVITIISHCTRSLEMRAHNVDWEALMLDELPAILEAHVRARDASEKCLQGPQPRSPLEIYHSINPHPALSPVPLAEDPMAVEDQRDNETAYRQLLVQHMLDVLLREEERSSDALRALLEGILGELILGQVVSEKVCDPSFLYEIIAKVAEEEHEKRQKRLSTEVRSASALFWTLVEFLLSFFVLLRILVSAIFNPLPARLSKRDRQTKAFLDMRIFGALAQLTRLNSRQPWLAGFLAYISYNLVSGPGQFAASNQWLDRLFSRLLYQSPLVDPALLVTVLHASRATLFPHNKPVKSKADAAPPRKHPAGEHAASASAAAAGLLRSRAAKAVLFLFPAPLVLLMLGGEQQGLAEVEACLQVFDQAYENRWVVYSILDRVVGRLMDELTVSRSAVKS